MAIVMAFQGIGMASTHVQERFYPGQTGISSVLEREVQVARTATQGHSLKQRYRQASPGFGNLIWTQIGNPVGWALKRSGIQTERLFDNLTLQGADAWTVLAWLNDSRRVELQTAGWKAFQAGNQTALPWKRSCVQTEKWSQNLTIPVTGTWTALAWLGDHSQADLETSGQAVFEIGLLDFLAYQRIRSWIVQTLGADTPLALVQLEAEIQNHNWMVQTQQETRSLVVPSEQEAVGLEAHGAGSEVLQGAELI